MVMYSTTITYGNDITIRLTMKYSILVRSLVGVIVVGSELPRSVHVLALLSTK